MKVFIGCSSKNDIDVNYLRRAKEIINYLSINNDLVFGGDANGIMGICYDSFKENGRKVYGVVNDIYSKCLDDIDCDENIITFSTLDRTKEMIKLADIFVFLPGGIGTYTEIFNVVEEERNYKFDKKIILYNEDGFFDKFIDMIEDGIKKKFIDKEIKKIILVVKNIDDLKKLIEE